MLNEVKLEEIKTVNIKEISRMKAIEYLDSWRKELIELAKEAEKISRQKEESEKNRRNLVNQFKNWKAKLEENLANKDGEINWLKDKNKKLENEKNDEIKKWTQKYWQKQKSFINHDIQLTKDQQKVKSLRRENKQLTYQISDKEKRKNKLNKQYDKLAKKYDNQIDNLRRLKQKRNDTISKLELEKQIIKNASSSLVNTITTTQQHLGVSDLIQITTTHKMPNGKSLKDLINFYNSTPQQGNNQPTIITEPQEITKEIKVEVEKPVVKEVDKIIKIESQEQKNEIIRLKNIIKELEGKLSQHNCEKIVVPNHKSNNEIILIICLMVLTLILTSQIILAKKKKKNKVNSQATEIVYWNDQK